MNKWIAEFELEDGDTMPEHMDLEYKGARIDFHCRPLEQEPSYDELLKANNQLKKQIEMLKLDRECDKPSGKWISVNERLPEPYMFVNATCRSLVDDRENWVVETIYLPIPKEHNPRHYSDWGNIPILNWGEAEVIAWMERIIPEPYKVEEQTGDKT